MSKNGMMTDEDLEAFVRNNPARAARLLRDTEKNLAAEIGRRARWQNRAARAEAALSDIINAAHEGLGSERTGGEGVR